ncbi:hypothetical protein [Pseudomonas asplenii]|uniref:hypothetical protein n=1 Tax=Pseudomonas asplenii TaxID=53407 RepID=UPI00235FFBC4|nr:hypothetical protein [Pseudomonas asplenii]
MLQAFSCGKSHLYRRYLGHREADEARVCEEDEITALIMGPLDYLPAATTSRFWRAMVEQDGRSTAHGFPEGPAQHVEMHFWPRRAIEPDLLVELHWPGGTRRLLLIEFKWNAALSGSDQLHRQWDEFLTPGEREDAWHLFIAPEISAGLNALAEGDIWDGRLLLRTWADVLEVLRHLRDPDVPGLQKWKKQVRSFLVKLGINRFRGFRHLTPPRTVDDPVIFYSPMNGFTKLVAPPTFPEADSPAFIWSTTP